MSDVIVLDVTPLGLMCHPRNPPTAATGRQWVDDLLVAGRRVILPEIADYELRRELLRRTSQVSIGILDQLGKRLEYLPLSTATMRTAAEFWALIRSAGKPTAADPALDADVILAAQSVSLSTKIVVATKNPRHIGRFVAAERWMNIIP